jgi:hypothetical protein
LDDKTRKTIISKWIDIVQQQQELWAYVH